MGQSAHKAYNSAWCCTSSKNPLRPPMQKLKRHFKARIFSLPQMAFHRLVDNI